MSELMHRIRALLKETIDVSVDQANYIIRMTIKKKIVGVIADPMEVITMMKMFGGLKEDIPMKIDINNDTQQISIKFQSENDFNTINTIMESLWDDTADMLLEVFQGNFNKLKDIPDIDD